MSAGRLVADPNLVAAVEAMVRKRVPASEVDDIVQAALTDAVASQDAPTDTEALRRWLSGVVRHKIADFYRRRDRERALDAAPEPAHVPSHEERDLLRWASRQLPSEEAHRTLDWMLHEADGEKLEAIAEREQIPATRVRQRVHRLRTFFRERWYRELVLASIAVLLLGIAWALLRAPQPPIAKDPPAPQQPTTPRIVDSPREERAPVLPAVAPDAGPLLQLAPPRASATSSAVRPAPTSAPPKAPSKLAKPSGMSSDLSEHSKK